MHQNNTKVNPFKRFALEFVGGLLGYTQDEALATAAAVPPVKSIDGVKTLSVSFQIQKDWDGVNGENQAVVKCLGGAFTNKPGAPFLSPWAIAVNGNPGFSVGGYACNGRALVGGRRTQIGFNAELGKGDFKVIKDAVKAAERAGKKHLQILVTGVTEAWASEGSKQYIPEFKGMFALNETGKQDKHNVVLKGRLRIATWQVVGEGDPGWVRLAGEREAFDLAAFADTMVATMASEPVEDRMAVAITALKARSTMAGAVAAASGQEPINVSKAADKATAPTPLEIPTPVAPAAPEEDGYLWE